MPPAIISSVVAAGTSTATCFPLAFAATPWERASPWGRRQSPGPDRHLCATSCSVGMIVLGVELGCMLTRLFNQLVLSMLCLFRHHVADRQNTCALAASRSSSRLVPRPPTPIMPSRGSFGEGDIHHGLSVARSCWSFRSRFHGGQSQRDGGRRASLSGSRVTRVIREQKFHFLAKAAAMPRLDGRPCALLIVKLQSQLHLPWRPRGSDVPKA